MRNVTLELKRKKILKSFIIGGVFILVSIAVLLSSVSAGPIDKETISEYALHINQLNPEK